jgi:predicted  nucleic acid-binding Zn-ribbon protein
MHELHTLRQHRAAMDDQIQRLEWAVTHGQVEDSADEEDLIKVEEALENLRKQRDEARHYTGDMPCGVAKRW